MTQRVLNREVAHVTGESAATIARLGFVPLTRGPVELEFEENRAPLTVDWDELEASRFVLHPIG